MNTPDPGTLMTVALVLPLFGAAVLVVLGRLPLLRDIAYVAMAVAVAGAVMALIPAVAHSGRPALVLAPLLPGVPLLFTLEPLGLLFAVLASGLFALNALYSIGYMRGTAGENQTRFYVAFAVSIAATLGIAFAGNMLTLFVFYEVLTLSTYPLVVHYGTAEARAGGRVYLGLLLGTSIGFLLVAMVWTYLATGTLTFTPGGILGGRVSPPVLAVLFALYMFGIGKAALMPFHAWLPAAMVAPTPVSAFLHAVAVVKAGVFTVLKVALYIFGLDTLAGSSAHEAGVAVACFTIVAASLIAWSKDNLKARLAYSTVSQLAYVVLGAALASPTGALGGALHVVTHAVGKITLFMAAGAIYVASHKTEISALDGLGRKMPVTFGCFFVASLSIIGLPPFAGAWSKWVLLTASSGPSDRIALVTLLASTLLSFAYLIPIVARAFLQRPQGGASGPGGIEEAPLACLLPMMIAAGACVLLPFAIDPILAFLSPLVSP